MKIMQIESKGIAIIESVCIAMYYQVKIKITKSIESLIRADSNDLVEIQDN